MGLKSNLPGIPLQGGFAFLFNFCTQSHRVGYTDCHSRTVSLFFNCAASSVVDPQIFFSDPRIRNDELRIRRQKITDPAGAYPSWTFFVAVEEICCQIR
jgi:hypothetical protein